MIVKHYIAGRMLLVQENTLQYVDVITGPTRIAAKLKLGELKIFQLENVGVMEEGVGIKSSVYLLHLVQALICILLVINHKSIE